MKINPQIQEILIDFKDEKHSWLSYHELPRKCFELEGEDWEKLKTLSDLYKKNTLINDEILAAHRKWEEGTFYEEFRYTHAQSINLIQHPYRFLTHYISQFPKHKKYDERTHINNHIQELFPERMDLRKANGMVEIYLEFKKKQLDYLDELSYVKSLEGFMEEKDWDYAVKKAEEGDWS